MRCRNGDESKVSASALRLCQLILFLLVTTSLMTINNYPHFSDSHHNSLCTASVATTSNTLNMLNLVGESPISDRFYANLWLRLSNHNITIKMGDPSHTQSRESDYVTCNVSRQTTTVPSKPQELPIKLELILTTCTLWRNLISMTNRRNLILPESFDFDFDTILYV